MGLGWYLNKVLFQYYKVYEIRGQGVVTENLIKKRPSFMDVLSLFSVNSKLRRRNWFVLGCFYPRFFFLLLQRATCNVSLANRTNALFLCGDQYFRNRFCVHPIMINAIIFEQVKQPSAEYIKSFSIMNQKSSPNASFSFTCCVCTLTKLLSKYFK